MRILSLAFLLCCAFHSFGQKRGEQPAKPFVIGEIQTIRSVILGEQRTLNIYLPEGYNAADTTHYPVVYLLDGSADEDFIHITGLYQFNSFPWIARVKPSIIVGIANVDRKRDFTFPSAIPADKALLPSSGGSDKFIRFLEQELQPFIRSKYKTSTSRTIIGESLGGLLCVEILFRRPSLFNRYIVVSPSLWWNDGSILKQEPEILSAGFNQSTEVFIGVGKEGVTPGDRPHVQEVDANVLADKLRHSKSKALKVYFDYLPEETHATIGHHAVLDALRLMAPANE